MEILHNGKKGMVNGVVVRQMFDNDDVAVQSWCYVVHFVSNEWSVCT